MGVTAPLRPADIDVEDVVDAHIHIWRMADLPWLHGPMLPRIFGPYEPIRRDYTITEYLGGARAAGPHRECSVVGPERVCARSQHAGAYSNGAGHSPFDTDDASSGQMHIELSTMDLYRKVFASRIMLTVAGHFQTGAC